MIELTPQVILEAKAKRFALAKHAGQMYGDDPYSYHLTMVVDNVRQMTNGDPLQHIYVAIAWLHDVMEDCGVTYKELVDEFGLCVAECVQRLTKTDGMTYEEYLMGCIGSAFARRVKIADTMANMTESFRNSGNTNPAVRAKGEKGMQKYPRQLDILVQGAYYERSF